MGWCSEGNFDNQAVPRIPTLPIFIALPPPILRSKDHEIKGLDWGPLQLIFSWSSVDCRKSPAISRAFLLFPHGSILWVVSRISVEIDGYMLEGVERSLRRKMVLGIECVVYRDNDTRAHSFSPRK